MKCFFSPKFPPIYRSHDKNKKITLPAWFIITKNSIDQYIYSKFLINHALKTSFYKVFVIYEIISVSSHIKNQKKILVKRHSSKKNDETKNVGVSIC